MPHSVLLQTDRQLSVLGGVGSGTHSYTPYGRMRAAAGLCQAFTGERLDEASSCYLLGNGHRAYSPALMRFHRPDRLSPFASGGLNAYAYCADDPINHRDPTGQSVEEYLFPVLSILVNLTGLFVSGLRLRSMHKVTQANSRQALTPTPAFLTLPPSPSRANWGLSFISAFSSVAGFTMGIARTVEPDEQWHMWPLAALTLVSLKTSMYEVYGLWRAKPWIAQQNVTMIARSNSAPSSLRTGRSGSNNDSTAAPRDAASVIRGSSVTATTLP